MEREWSRRLRAKIEMRMSDGGTHLVGKAIRLFYQTQARLLAGEDAGHV